MYVCRVMLQRKGMVRMFGEDFLAEEANAIDKMLSMLGYKQTLLTPTFHPTSSHMNDPTMSSFEDMKELMMTTSTTAVMMDQIFTSTADRLVHQGGTTKGGDDYHGFYQQQLTMHEIFQLVLNRGSNKSSSTSTTVGDGNAHPVEGEEDVIYLPKFVRDPLMYMRYANTPEGKNNRILLY